MFYFYFYFFPLLEKSHHQTYTSVIVFQSQGVTFELECSGELEKLVGSGTSGSFPSLGQSD